ncbi:MAG: sugar transferase [Spirulina sp. SIO3F2]|nr:sugar transferase [Spirulina sp. SIO3F2]
MTAEIHWVPAKLIQGLIVKGRQSLAVQRRYRTRNQLARLLNGAATKRLFDIVFSSAILVACSPLYLILMVLIAATSPGPIFFVQKRIGRNYRPFRCFKFRTMVRNADAVLEDLIACSPHLQAEFEADFKLRRDPRITAMGRFLRMTSLDELPQFWNVLKGDMSVVGPRPLVPQELPRYGRHMDRVLTIKPGITGLWQVSGRNDIPYHRRVQMDVYYAGYRTWWLDLFVVIKTVFIMLFPRNNGAY